MDQISIGQPSKSERAARAVLRARRATARRESDSYQKTVRKLEAEAELRDLPELLAPPERLRRASGEAVAEYVARETFDPQRQRFLDTLGEPDSIAVEASEQRLQAALKAGVLPMALDAAHSANASNCLETMLCHQLAAAHHLAMTFAGAMPCSPADQQPRLANAAARMMQVFQEGLLTLQRVKTGRHQTVVVQHVTVADGAQAVVAGAVGQGLRDRDEK